MNFLNGLYFIKADEQRYDACYKVDKAKKETDELRNKHKELKGKLLYSIDYTYKIKTRLIIQSGLSENITKMHNELIP